MMELKDFGFELEDLKKAWENVVSQRSEYESLGSDQYLRTLGDIKKDWWYQEALYDEDAENHVFAVEYENATNDLIFLHGEEQPIEVSSFEDLVEALTE